MPTIPDTRQAMHKALDEFRAAALSQNNGKPFSSSVQSIFDHFRNYIGVPTLLHAPAPYTNVKQNLKQGNMSRLKVESKYIRAEPRAAGDESRLASFLRDPSRVVSVFFSSYFREKGLCMSARLLAEGPTLVIAILSSFVSHPVISPLFQNEGESLLDKALKMARRALDELPAAQKAAEALPEGWGRACKALWPHADAPAVLNTTANTDMVLAASDTASGWGDDPSSFSGNTSYTTHGNDAPLEIELNLNFHKMLNFDEESDVAEVVTATKSFTFNTPGASRTATCFDPRDWGWTEPSRSTAIEWITETVQSQDQGGGGWLDASPRGQFTTTPEAILSEGQAASILQYVGPSSMPLSCIPCRMEKSIRWIDSISKPRSGDNDDDIIDSHLGLRRHLALVTLSLRFRHDILSCHVLSIPLSVGSENDEEALVHVEDSPVLFEQNAIQVLVDSAVVEDLTVGMGLDGEWVCVTSSPKTQKRQRGRKDKGREKHAGGRSGEWWYARNILFVMPSYWTEEGS